MKRIEVLNLLQTLETKVFPNTQSYVVEYMEEFEHQEGTEVWQDLFDSPVGIVLDYVLYKKNVSENLM